MQKKCVGKNNQRILYNQMKIQQNRKKRVAVRHEIGKELRIIHLCLVHTNLPFKISAKVRKRFGFTKRINSHSPLFFLSLRHKKTKNNKKWKQ